MNIKVLGTEYDFKIDQFLEKQIIKNTFQTTTYGKVLEYSYGIRRFYIGSLDGNDNLTGLLPIYLCSKFPAGRQFVSLPFSAWYNSIIFQSEEEKETLINFAKRIGGEMGVSHLELKESIAFTSTSADDINESFACFVLDLPDDNEVLFKELFNTKLRNQIRKSKKFDFEWEIGGIEFINPFYEVYFECMVALGSPAHSKKFFHELILRFPDTMRIAITWSNGTPAAVLWLSCEGNTLFNPWAGSKDKYKRNCVNNFIYWHALKWAIDNNFKKFDFGRSMKGGSHNKFKKQWGVQEIPVRYIKYNIACSEVSDINPNSKSIIIFRKIWSSLPFFILRLISPFFAKKVP